jgi:5-methylcytosine-specific restriction protein A
MLRDILGRFHNEFLKASHTELKGNDFANYARNDASEFVQQTIMRPDLKVTVSIGQGNWAEIPWVGIFNPEITTSATNGIYVVYLFSSDLNKVYLCQGQGVTSVKEEFGKGQAEELKRRAELIRSRVPEYHQYQFSGTGIQLNGKSSLAKSYDPAVAYFKAYDLTQIPQNDELEADLHAILNLYDLLVARGGTDNIETFTSFAADHDTSEIQETRQYVRHSRIERNTAASKKVKNILGHICMGCGFDFKRIYGDRGKDYIEAHHLTPLHMLPEGKAVSMNPEEDFAVLCANCHRMVHRKQPMLSLDELRNLKGVKMLRNAFNQKKAKQSS